MCRGLVGMMVLACVGPATGEEPVGPPITAAEALLTGDPLGVGQQHRWGAQIQFGLPTGLRLQYALFRSSDHSYLLELFAGGESAFWGEEAVYGAGGRAFFTLTSDGHNDALIFAPGVSVQYWQGADRPSWAYSSWETDRYFLTIDANLGWLHELTPSLGFELGLNVGARIGLSGNDGHKSISGRVSGGNIGVYTGIRY